MRLVVVYGLKTLDYGYFSLFYPSRRLAEECTNRSIPLRFLFPRDVSAFLEERIDTALKRDTVCLIRGKVDPATVRLLETAGFYTVNSAASLSLANDKFESARFLQANGWPTPETRLAGGTVIASRTVPAGGTVSAGVRFPLVSKPRFGSRGEGVRLVAGIDELAGLGPDTILQEYVESSRGRDLRFFFAGDEILAVAGRQAAGNGFVSNANSGGTMRSAPHSAAELAPWCAMTLGIARKAGLWYGSVDYLYCAEVAGTGKRAAAGGLELTVCELNGSPGFEALETECGINIAGPLVERLAGRFRSV